MKNKVNIFKDRPCKLCEKVTRADLLSYGGFCGKCLSSINKKLSVKEYDECIKILETGKPEQYASTYTEFSERVKYALLDLAHDMDMGILKILTMRYVKKAHEKIMMEYRRIFRIGEFNG